MLVGYSTGDGSMLVGRESTSDEHSDVPTDVGVDGSKRSDGLPPGVSSIILAVWRWEMNEGARRVGDKENRRARTEEAGRGFLRVWEGCRR